MTKLEELLTWCKDKTLPKPDLCGADLRYADLSGADLRYADLSGTNLRYADLSGADLSGTNLRYADLCGADLCGADLRYADLCGADLCGADLSGADLSGTNLSGADLSGTNLSGADLSGTNLNSTIGNCVRIFSLQLPAYKVTILDKEVMQIGCKRFTIQEWANFDDNAIAKFALNALTFWKTNKELIFKYIEVLNGQAN